MGKNAKDSFRLGGFYWGISLFLLILIGWQYIKMQKIQELSKELEYKNQQLSKELENKNQELTEKIEEFHREMKELLFSERAKAREQWAIMGEDMARDIQDFFRFIQENYPHIIGEVEEFWARMMDEKYGDLDEEELMERYGPKGD